MGDLDEAEFRRLRTVADYQFGAGAGEALFPTPDLEVQRTTSGRTRQVSVPADGDGDGPRRLVTYRTDGRFTLGLAGGERLQGAVDGYRVAVGEESVPFVREGKNAFAKFVRWVDDGVRPGDEVRVLGPDGDLLAVGRAELPADGMRDFETGMAVMVREGRDG